MSGPSHDQRSSKDIALTTGGLTLLSVLLSIGVTVGVSVKPWWAGVLAGAFTTLVLTVVIKVTTSAGRGPLARMANWIIGKP